MLIVRDPPDPRPVYAQIAEQVRGQIQAGEIDDGERLPSAAELAKSLGLNRNTVLQAYRLLRDQGCLDLRRGRGAIARAPRTTTDPLDAAVHEIIRIAKDRGLSLDSVSDLLARGGLT